jgi:hypothetical protein
MLGAGCSQVDLVGEEESLWHHRSAPSFLASLILEAGQVAGGS